MPSSSNKPLILITGANQGLGYAATKILADSGRYHVILACRSAAKGEEAIARLAAENPAVDASALTPVTMDVTDDASIAAARDAVAARFGHLDVLVNSAGVNGVTPERRDGLRASYRHVFEVNVFGPAATTAAFLPLLRASPRRDRRVVNVSTGLGQIGVALADDTIYGAARLPLPEYRCSKAALNMLTAVGAATCRAEGIAFVAVCPGHTRTRFTEGQGVKEPAEGAANIVRAATEGDPRQMYGKLQADELVEYGW